MKGKFMDNLGSSTVGERGILAMTARLMTEVYTRSFLIWCFEKYGGQMKLKHNDRIYNVVNVDESGCVTGIDLDKKVILQPNQAINKLPVKAVRYFQDNWVNFK